MHKKLLLHDTLFLHRSLMAILVVGMLMLQQAYASGADSTGTVIGVRGETVIFEVTSGPDPSVGDLAELSFEMGGEQFVIGTWRITKFVGPVIEASRVDAELEAEKGMIVRIRGTPEAPQAGGETLAPVSAAAIPARREMESTEIMFARVSEYRRIWTDKGSGASRDFGVWRPVGRDGFYPLGDVANAGPWPGRRYPPPDFDTLLVRGGKPPVGYRMVWNTERSHPDRPFSSWTPVAPPGYRCIGDVGSASLDASPPLDVIRCLPQQCIVETELKQKIWDDTGSGARLDFSAWFVPGVNVFAGNASHKKPVGVFYTVKSECR